MGFCSSCGAALPEGANNCPTCGHPVGAPRPPAFPAPTRRPQPRPPHTRGGWQRVAAAIIDGIVLGIPGGILAVLVGGTRTTRNVIQIDQFNRTTRIRQVGFELNAKGILVLVILGVLYRVFLEGGPRGQTLGKMAMKIAVRDQSTGGPIGYGRAFVRWLAALVLWIILVIPGIIDVLFPLWDPRHQTLHDKAAGSIVVRV